MSARLCRRCVKHAGEEFHWCIKLVFSADGSAVIGPCACGCELHIRKRRK